MLKSLLFFSSLLCLAESYGQNTDSIFFKIQSIDGDYIFFEIENRNEHSIRIGNPECWTNLQTYLTTNSEEIPTLVKYKQDVRCINDLVQIRSKCKRRFKVEYKTGQLYYRLKDGEELELHFYGMIMFKTRVIKEYGKVIISEKLSLND